MDQSLPGTESVFCFWPVLNPAPQCNFPMALENFIVEPFHGQEFSTNAHSQTWNFPLVLYVRISSRVRALTGGGHGPA